MIKEFYGYKVDSNGTVYRKDGKKMSAWSGGTSKYLCVSFNIEKGVNKKCLLHRVIAELFVPNPENKPHVNHIDRNIFNNDYSNLEWCTPKENINHSINNGVSPIKNFKESYLYKGDELIGEFKSVMSACKYAGDTYGVKVSMLNKHRIWKDFRVVKKEV